MKKYLSHEHKACKYLCLRNNAISSVRRLYGDSTLYIIIESIMHIDIYYDKIKNKNKNKNNIYICFILCVVAALQPPYFDVITTRLLV